MGETIMASRTYGPGPARRGFTLMELLVAMALIVLLTNLAALRFVAGIETFRDLKGIGDMNEGLRESAHLLRRNLLAVNQTAVVLIEDGVRTGAVDPKETDALRADYEAICAHAGDLDARLAEMERQTVNPAARRLLGRIRKELDQVKTGTARMVWLLELIESSGDS